MHFFSLKDNIYVRRTLVLNLNSFSARKTCQINLTTSKNRGRTRTCCRRYPVRCTSARSAASFCVPVSPSPLAFWLDSIGCDWRRYKNQENYGCSLRKHTSRWFVRLMNKIISLNSKRNCRRWNQNKTICDWTCLSLSLWFALWSQRTAWLLSAPRVSALNWTMFSCERQWGQGLSCNH